MTEVLNQDQIDHYNDQGYLVLENAIPPEWMTKIHEEIERFEDEARGMTLTAGS